MTRLLFAVPALVLSAASLKSCLKPGKDPLPEPKPRGQITAEACGAYELPAEISQAGWEAGARDALSVSLFSRITAVRVVRVGCKVSLSVVPACRVPGRYRFLRRHRVDARKIESAESLFAELPLTAAALAAVAAVLAESVA